MAGGTLGKVGGAIAHGEAIGGKRSKEYQTWIGMRLRCRQKPHYVKHGVKVCDRWQSSFASFLADVGRAPSAQHTLDRWPNPDGHYEPGNVRWATMLEQRHNRRVGSRAGGAWRGKKRPEMSGANSPLAKLTADDVVVIRALKAGGARTVDVAKRFSVTRRTITNVISGRTWAGGFDGHS